MENILLELDVRFTVMDGLYGITHLGGVESVLLTPEVKVSFSDTVISSLYTMGISTTDVTVSIMEYLNLNGFSTVVNDFELMIKGNKVLVCLVSHSESNIALSHKEVDVLVYCEED